MLAHAADHPRVVQRSSQRTETSDGTGPGGGSRVSAGPTRRSVLATSALAAAGLAAPELGLTACAPRPTAPPKPPPDVVLVRKMITEKETLIARYTGVRDAYPPL